MGLIADIAETMKNLKAKGERATPERVIALALRSEGGKTDAREHEQRESTEDA